MLTEDAITSIGNRLLNPKGLKVTSSKILQNLWAGYGHIAQIDVVSLEDNTKKQSLILKTVTAPTPNAKHHDEGHLRKVISYQVEQYFYTAYAPKIPAEIAMVAKCVAGINEPAICCVPVIALALEDLRERFPVEVGERRGVLGERQVDAALRWLAGFHGFWWRGMEGVERGTVRLPPLEEVKRHVVGVVREGVWLNGGYTYLATRQKEYRDLKNDKDSEWSHLLCTPTSESRGRKTTAEIVAQILAPSPKPSPSSSISKYETLIHGDVKSENLFSNAEGTEVAFFDFQYVGLGLGVCDLAKLFTCSVPLSLLMEDNEVSSSLEMQEGERKLLAYYQKTLQDVSGKEYPCDVLAMHWKTALVDWLRFQASWGFWGNTEWLEARVRYILQDQEWKAWAVEAAAEKS